MIGIGIGISNYYNLGGGAPPGPTYDSDAQAFFDRVDTAGGTLSFTEKVAVNTLVLQMKADGIWTKMKAIYPMVGASAASCAQNLKSSSFTGTFTATGWTFSSLGVKGNGANANFNTNLNTNTSLNTNSAHISYYSNDNFAIENPLMSNNSLNCFIQNAGGTILYGSLATTSFINFNNTIEKAFFLMNRPSSSSQKLIRNNSILVSGTQSSSSYSNDNIYLNRYQTTYCDARCALASIGDGLTDAEASDLYTAVQGFNTTLSRNVGAPWYDNGTLLLDSYPSSAAAYSLRKLRNKYIGGPIRVRRSSDNTEQDIYFDANGELDTAQLLSFVGTGATDNGFVTTWYDQSGNGYNATQTTAANQPQIVSSGSVILQNSKPTITHTSSTPLLLSSTVNLTNAYAMYGIAKFNANDKELFGDSSTGFGFSYGIYQNANELYHGAGGTFTGNFGAGYGLTFNLLTIERAGTASTSIYKNSNIFNTKTLNANANFYLSSLSGERGQSYIFSGNLSEAIFYASDQSTNRTGISTNINSFYSIY